MSESASPRNARLEAVSRFISAAGLAVLLLSAATVIAVRLLIMAFPGMLDGRDIIEAGLHPNYLRNILELISFVSGLLLVITAIFAGGFTISQIREAEKTRLATLYTTLEARWASPEMLKSKTAFDEISKAYLRAKIFGPSKTDAPYEVFADQYLSRLSEQNYAEYSSVMSLIDFFEYIGMLELSGYLKIDDIKYLLGSVCIEVYAIMSVHIEKLRIQETERLTRNNLGNAPEQYLCFRNLVDQFKAQFSSA